MRKLFASLGCIPVVVLVVPTPVGAIERPDLEALSIEELAQLPVRSTSVREEPRNGAPTSPFIKIEEDVIASSTTSLPEVPRLAAELESNDLNEAHRPQRSIIAGSRLRF